MRVIITHGTMGSPGGNWFPWLKSELAKFKVECLAPQYPTPQNQSLNAWLDTFQKRTGSLKPTDILVGHSIGAPFVLRVLERSTVTVKAAFLVAGFARTLGKLPEYDTLNASFVEPPFDWAAIKERAALFKVYIGDNDPYVTLAHGREVSGALGVEPVVIKNGGHLNAESGFTAFPLLLGDLRSLLTHKA